MASPIAASASKIVLEVERKFVGFAVPSLTKDAGVPPFRSLIYRGQLDIQDAYYDRQSLLSKNGLWVRKRQVDDSTATWEAKWRKGGAYNNSMFEEMTNTDDISRQIQSLTGSEASEDRDFGLTVMAVLKTRRRTWFADDRFKIVLDNTDFDHEVGEVELEQVVTPPHQIGSPLNEVWKRELTEIMDRDIQAFMKRYDWAFKPGKPEGKLTAYFARQQHR